MHGGAGSTGGTGRGKAGRHGGAERSGNGGHPLQPFGKASTLV